VANSADSVTQVSDLTDVWKSLDENNPIVLDRSEIDDRNIKFMANVTFRDINSGKPQPAIATLQQFVDVTKGIVKIFEDRFFKQASIRGGGAMLQSMPPTQMPPEPVPPTEDDVLRRMLNTPPQAHAPRPKKKTVKKPAK
jgi:hypothetical protein